MFTTRSVRPHRSLPAILLAVLVFLAASLAVASPAAAAPISNPSLEIPVGCPGARAVIQVKWEGTQSAQVHWELSDTGADGKSPVIKIVARDPSGDGTSWIFRNGEVTYTVSGGKGSSAGGNTGSWNPDGIAQFNHLEVKVSNGTTAEGTECSIVRKIYNFSRIAYQHALNQIDKSYVWGAEGPNTFDCSGLVYYTYNLVPNFPTWSRMSSAQQHSWASSAANDNNADLSNLHSRDAIRVSRTELQIGDLVFYDGHVGYYAGSGWMYSAINEDLDIGYLSIDYKTPTGYYRIVGVTS